MAVEGGSRRGRDDHHESAIHSRGKKKYQRHTSEQIQLLEATFDECPHPDENLRSQLSQEMGLTPRQIKFWFQNRRTQLKAKSETADNSLLKMENHKIRSENIAIKEALKNAICSTCGGPHSAQGDCHEEQRLHYENAQLKKELERVSTIVSRYIGRPIMSQFPPDYVEQSHLCSPDLSMVTSLSATQQRMVTMASGGPPPNGIIVSASNTIHPSHPLLLTGMQKSLIADIATSALKELMRLIKTNEPFWTKSADGRDVLDIDNYERMFPRPNTSTRNPNLWVEASRATGHVMVDSLQLVEMFNDSAKWAGLFPTIVLQARTIEVISSGLFGNRSGSLQLMYEELQVTSQLVPIRQFTFIRYCQQINQETWAVVDFSYDLPRDDGLPYSQLNSRRLPSGCLIRRRPNGYSKIIWIEHVEIEEKTTFHRLYRDLIYSGLAFGAERWISCLQRSCERIVFQMMANSSMCELGVITSAEGKKSMMKLAQRMVNNFCASISHRDGHLWSCESDFDNFEVHTTLYKSTDYVRSNTTILGATTTVWLSHSPESVFDFLRDESNRPKWDVLASNKPVHEVTQITNGAHPGNRISVLRAQNTRNVNILILQESCTNSSESLVVYCPVDLTAINIAMRGEEPVNVPLLPSGFAITSDGRHSMSISGNTSNGVASSGSLLTLVVKMVVSGLPCEKLGEQSVATINNIIGNRVREIKAAMINCSSTTT
ncbi:hypothetical protein LXL04_014959 [Taraxacum kok-saghyz]